MMAYIADLNSTDSPVDNYFVTAVTETNGIVSTTKARPTFTTIAGTAAVTQGGTGATNFNAGEVLIGMGENPV